MLGGRIVVPPSEEVGVEWSAERQLQGKPAE